MLIGLVTFRKLGLASSLVLAALSIAEPASAAIIGPDVSSWQHPNGASINWNLVKAAGHSFAFVKATEDTNYINPNFAADWSAIAAAGMDRGPYHFARPGSTASAAAQAAYFASAIGSMGHPGDLPPVLDLETTGGLSPDNLIAWTQSFLSTTQTLTNRVPMIYVSPNFWRTNMKDSNAFTSYPLWIAQWTSASSPSFPLPGGWTSWTFWQYTDSGRIPGVANAVDVSHYCCSFGSLSALAFGSTTTQAPSPPSAGGTNLYAAVLNGPGLLHIDIHALAQSSHYTGFSLHSSTIFGAAVAADWQFFVASYQGDGQPDLFGVHMRNTDSGQVEVHILSAVSGYQTFALHSATPLPAVPANHVEFDLGSLAGDHRSNLYAIALNSTGSNTVEVHALSEASNYKAWVIHSTTALATIRNTGDWQFRIGDGRGSGDLIGISHTSTGSGRTEVHVLSRAHGYQAFSIHSATPLGYTSDAQFAYAMGDHDNDGIPDIYAVAMNGTMSGQTEVHVLSGASNYNGWIEHTPTGLPPTSVDSWQFATY